MTLLENIVNNVINFFMATASILGLGNVTENNQQTFNSTLEDNTKIVKLSNLDNNLPYYFVQEDKIFVRHPNGTIERIKLFGVNWFGFETQNYVVHGLWSRNYKEMLDQIKELGFNAIRLPFCTYSIEGRTPTGIDYYKNPELKGLNSLEIMKKIVEEANKRGIYILLDYHRIGCNYIEPLWYTKDFSEQDFIEVWKKVAQEFKDYPNVIGADLKNEPHSEGTGDSLYTNGTTWGYNEKTDWNLAAERIGREILKITPHWLIFVEGTQVTNPEIDKNYKYGLNAWWGGNLMAVKKYPINLPQEKLVYSPHVYGPDVYNQPYFNDPNFPNNMPEIWYKHFAYVKIDLKKPVVIGEFGGKFGEGNPKDKIWQEAIIDYMIKNNFCDFFYWSWNPNSGDTGGILKDDWESINWEKYKNLKRLMDYCEGKISKEEALKGIISNNVINNKDNVDNQSNQEITEEKQDNNQINNNELIISYPEEQWPTAFVDSDNNGVYDFVMEINPWNIKNSEGFAKMTFKEGKVIYEQDLRNIELKNPGAWVHGYPEIYIGNKPWNGNYADQNNIFPKKLSQFSDTLISLNYKINNENEPMNLAFESWLTTDKKRSNGIRNNEIEVMIWFYYNELQPAGSKVGEEKLKVKVNNELKELTFEVWKAFIGWEYIAFRVKEPIKEANITFNLKEFLDLLYKYSDFDKNHLDNLYVEDIEVGTEYGTPYDKNIKFSWEFSNFKATLGTLNETLNQNQEIVNKSQDNNNSKEKFLELLNNSWLQLFTSSNQKDPTNFENENFYFDNNELVFNMCENKKRVELRHKEEWSINNNAEIEVKVKLDPKDSQEFTFLQILSYDLREDGSKYYKPLLRIHWNKDYKGKENHIWATLRLSLYESKFKKFDLGGYNDKYLNLKVSVDNRTIKIIRDNEILVEEKIDNWNYNNFFKLGVYIQKGGCAEARFEEVMISINKDSPKEENNNIGTNLKLNLNYPIKWFYKLSEPLKEYEINEDYELYDIDLFDNSKEIIQKLREKNKLVVCYFSFGTYENWREDTKNLDESLLGNPLENWEGERYWDIRNEEIKKILKSRIDLAKEKGCNGVEFDNVDIYKNNNGLGINKEDVIEVFKELSSYAREKGLFVVFLVCSKSVFLP